MISEETREPRLYVCDNCGYEDEFNNVEDKMDCVYCKDGTLRVVSKEEVKKVEKAFGL